MPENSKPTKRKVVRKKDPLPADSSSASTANSSAKPTKRRADQPALPLFEEEFAPAQTFEDEPAVTYEYEGEELASQMFVDDRSASRAYEDQQRARETEWRASAFFDDGPVQAENPSSTQSSARTSKPVKREARPKPAREAAAGSQRLERREPVKTVEPVKRERPTNTAKPEKREKSAKATKPEKREKTASAARPEKREKSIKKPKPEKREKISKKEPKAPLDPQVLAEQRKRSLRVFIIAIAVSILVLGGLGAAYLIWYEPQHELQEQVQGVQGSWVFKGTDVEVTVTEDTISYEGHPNLTYTIDPEAHEFVITEDDKEIVMLYSLSEDGDNIVVLEKESESSTSDSESSQQLTYELVRNN